MYLGSSSSVSFGPVPGTNWRHHPLLWPVEGRVVESSQSRCRGKKSSQNGACLYGPRKGQAYASVRQGTEGRGGALSHPRRDKVLGVWTERVERIHNKELPAYLARMAKDIRDETERLEAKRVLLCPPWKRAALLLLQPDLWEVSTVYIYLLKLYARCDEMKSRRSGTVVSR